MNYRKFKPEHQAFIKSIDPDVLALQEVSAQFHSNLENSGLFDWSKSSLLIRPPATDAPRARRLGCSIFGKKHCVPVQTNVLLDVVFPERTLIVEAQTPVGLINFCSFHIPPGASWKAVKPQTMVFIATHLATLPGIVMVGIDANSPKVDHPDHNQNVWWWEDEPRLLGISPDHHLRDALRLYLENHPEKQQEIKRNSPNGPLALSHVRGCGPVRTDCRYDFILISPRVRVASIDYLFADSLKAGSDHAIVAAELEVGEY